MTFKNYRTSIPSLYSHTEYINILILFFWFANAFLKWRALSHYLLVTLKLKSQEQKIWQAG